jgi:hypothetical protein
MSKAEIDILRRLADAQEQIAISLEQLIDLLKEMSFYERSTGTRTLRTYVESSYT